MRIVCYYFKVILEPIDPLERKWLVDGNAVQELFDFV
jgi:hypothetical protein